MAKLTDGQTDSTLASLHQIGRIQILKHQIEGLCLIGAHCLRLDSWPTLTFIVFSADNMDSIFGNSQQAREQLNANIAVVIVSIIIVSSVIIIDVLSSANLNVSFS